MCLIAFAWHATPAFPLVLVANRDEFHARPATPLALWPQTEGQNPRSAQFFGGRDLLAGGSWLAVSNHGRLAAVTNFREAQVHRDVLSRGHLVQDFLQSTHSAAEFAADRLPTAQNYGPFNLLICDGEALVHLSNRPVGATQIDAGVHGLSNGTLDAPWPKSLQLNAALQQWLRAASNTPENLPDTAALFEALADRHGADDAHLPNTGVGLARERLLSPVFIAGEQYGTRASSVVLVRHDGSIHFIERRFGPGGTFLGDTTQHIPPIAEVS